MVNAEAREQKGGLFGFHDVLHTLMTKEMGYSRFEAHGGDWGSTITEQLARNHASSLIDMHLPALLRHHERQRHTMAGGSGERVDRLVRDASNLRALAQRYFPSPARMGGTILQCAALDSDAKGGHFAALEEPEALAADIRKFFRPLRELGSPTGSGHE